jgi:LysM repeat protein
MPRNRIFVLYALLVIFALGAGLLVARGLGPKAVLLTDYATAETTVSTSEAAVSTSEGTAGQQATATFPAASTANPTIENAVTATVAAPTAINSPTSPASATEAPATIEPTAIPGSGFVEYTIQRGDILKTIAERHEVTIQDILAVNEIPNPDSLTVGAVIRIPKK